LESRRLTPIPNIFILVTTGEMQGGDAQIFYGLGPEGYSVISETGEISDRSRLILVDFCKSVSWRPEKLDFPDQTCIAVVPDEEFIWLCQLKEGERDKFDRGLSFSVTASRYRRSDRAFTEELRRLTNLQDAENETEDFNPQVDLDGAVVLNHPELLSFTGVSIATEGQGARSEFSDRHRDEAEMCDRDKNETTDEMKKQRAEVGSHPGRLLKNVFLLSVGVVIGGSLTWWWGAIPKDVRISELEDSLRVTFLSDGPIDGTGIRDAYQDFKDSESDLHQRVDAWESVARELHLDARNPQQFVEAFRAAAEENSRLLEEIERAREGLSKEDLRALDLMRGSKELSDALEANEIAVKDLQDLLDNLTSKSPLKTLKEKLAPER